MLVFFFLAVVLAAVSLKLRQDARFQNAMVSLDQLGMRHTVSGDGLRLECRESRLSDAAVHELIGLLEVLGQPHDLGLAPGLAIESIDLNGAEVSREALAQLCEALPATQINE